MTINPDTSIPQHVAVIMDGNGRWAEQRGKTRYIGHQAGVEQVRNLLKVCRKQSIQVLTLFAFSSENWQRPKLEVKLLLNLFVLKLRQEVDQLQENNIRLRVIGNISAFPAKLQTAIKEVEDLTRKNNALVLQIAANYGGRWDITQAVRNIAVQVAEGTLQPDQIEEQHITQALAFPDVPEPDLFIRTGGELRISNFMLWQSAYTELYFTDTLWPDFDTPAFQLALDSYAQRQRRFGKTSQQLKT